MNNVEVIYLKENSPTCKFGGLVFLCFQPSKCSVVGDNGEVSPVKVVAELLYCQNRCTAFQFTRMEAFLDTVSLWLAPVVLL